MRKLCGSMIGLMIAGAAIPSARAEETPLPSIVILLADDLGYGDLGCFGHPTIRTPNLDRMATEGVKFTQYYAWCYCTPSRAALLLGRLPVRSGLNRVLGAKSTGGIPDGEITLAQALKARGYATMCIGKWHLGHLPQFLPTRHGFDHYLGIPYSNDMDRCRSGRAANSAHAGRDDHRAAGRAGDVDPAVHRGSTQVHPRPCRRGQAGPAVLPLSAVHLSARAAACQPGLPGKEPAWALWRRRRGA